MRANRTNHAPVPRLTLAALVVAAVGVMPTATATGGTQGRTCFGKQPTKVGTQGSDVIHGTPRRDVIVSLGGKDRITAGDGNDYVCAGRGNDNAHGAEDVNRMKGGPGDDWLDGRRGDGNVAFGGAGNDYIQAEGKIDGGDGKDVIESFGYQSPSASPVPDVTEGDSGSDRIMGGPTASCSRAVRTTTGLPPATAMTGLAVTQATTRSRARAGTTTSTGAPVPTCAIRGRAPGR